MIYNNSVIKTMIYIFYPFFYRSTLYSKSTKLISLISLNYYYKQQSEC